jgi:dCMP deaminase
MNAQIKEIVYAVGYPDDLSELMLLESNISKRNFTIPQNEIKMMLGDFSTKEGED